MEPRPFDRGNDTSHRVTGQDCSPSMEPRPFDRGNCVEDFKICQWCGYLQWSHGHSTVETSFSSSRTPDRVACLKWSHGHSTVETCPTHTRGVSWSILQWSHGHSTVETLLGLPLPGLLSGPSMEPRPFDRGNITFSMTLPAGLTAFNGATAIRPWKPGPRKRGFRQCCPFNGATAIRPWKRLFVA